MKLLSKVFFASAMLLMASSSALFARNDGKIVTDSLQSTVLGAQVKYNVYLPFGYNPDNHYPVIYLLHGLTDDYTAWTVRGGMATVANELMEEGQCVPAVIIMPNAGGPDLATAWNGYFNMEGWSYEDFFFGEFLPAVEARYNAGGSKGRRAVMGLSMGGGGSTVYCQRHPDIFSSCYAMSAWLDNKEEDIKSDREKFPKLYAVCRAVREHSALNFVNNADAQTVEALRTVKWVFDCGDDDSLLYLSCLLHKSMQEKNIKSELRVNNGIHNWEYWHLALRKALPFASRNFFQSGSPDR